jgi:lauroyl/myristoyl acyltransferase
MAATTTGRLARATALPRWYSHGLNRAALYHVAAAAGRCLPRGPRLRLAGAVARRAAARLPRERAVVEANLARVLPGADTTRRAALVADVFGHFGMCFADLIVANRRLRTVERLLAGVEGAGTLDAVAGRGLVVVTAHLGNWELGGRLLARQLGRPTHVVVAAEPDPGVERFLRGAPAPMRFVPRADPRTMLSLVPALRRGEVVALQGDRALGARGDAPVPFFGAAAPFPLGPFVLARAAAVPVVPAFCVLGSDIRYTIRLGAPIEVARNGEADGLVRWVAVLEAAVRRHPEQWFNFFDVWSPGPES